MTAILILFQKQLALLFDKLRIASPIIYTLVIVIIFGLSSVIEQFGSIEGIPAWITGGIVDEVLMFLSALLLSSRTKRHIEVADDDEAGVLVKGIDHDD